MDNVRLQISIPGWSLQRLKDESVNLSQMLKVAGIDSFEIAEVHSMTAPDSRNDEDVIEENTLNLNTNEVDTKPPFCSTPRMSLLTPVPFPPIEASRISANPAKMIEWISRRENTQETLTEMVETDTTVAGEPEKLLERTFEKTNSFTQLNSALDDVIIDEENEQNVSFHSVTSSISAEVEGIRDLQKTRENSERSASCTSGVEEVSRNFDATIQLEDLKTYPSFDLTRGMTDEDEIPERVYNLLRPMQIDSPYQNIFKSISEALNLNTSYRSANNVYNEDEDVVMGTPENEVFGDEDQGAGPFSDIEVDVESISENCDVHPVETTPQSDRFSEISCQFPGCKTRINWRPKFGKAGLLNHAFRHVEENLVKCRTCDQPFNNTRQLRRHIKKTHPTEPIPSGIKSLEIPDDVLADLWGKCYSANLASIGTPVTQSKHKRLKRRTLAKMHC